MPKPAGSTAVRAQPGLLPPGPLRRGAQPEGRRFYPDKVAAWNAEAAMAFFALGQSSGRRDLIDIAVRTLEFMRRNLVTEKGAQPGYRAPDNPLRVGDAHVPVDRFEAGSIEYLSAGGRGPAGSSRVRRGSARLYFR